MSDPTTKLQEKIDKGGMYVELGTFKDKNSDFSFYFPQAKTLADAVSHLDGVTKGKGEETAVMLLNANLSFRFRGKANSKLQDPEERQKLKNEGKTLLISPEDAMTYEPGTRETTSEQGLLRQRGEALKQAATAKKAGDTETYKTWILKARACQDQLDTLAAAAMSELDNLEVPA